jgi:hypothetical protein
MTINGGVLIASFQNLLKLAIQSGKKVKGPTLFKLSQHHTNNWEAGKLFLRTTIFSMSMSNPLSMDEFNNGIFYGDKRYDNWKFPSWSCICFVVMFGQVFTLNAM